MQNALTNTSIVKPKAVVSIECEKLPLGTMKFSGNHKLLPMEDQLIVIGSVKLLREGYY